MKSFPPLVDKLAILLLGIFAYAKEESGRKRVPDEAFLTLFFFNIWILSIEKFVEIA
jgi:hypothetical protein